MCASSVRGNELSAHNSNLIRVLGLLRPDLNLVLCMQGEEQKKLDVVTNEVLKNALKFTGKVSRALPAFRVHCQIFACFSVPVVGACVSLAAVYTRILTEQRLASFMRAGRCHCFRGGGQACFQQGCLQVCVLLLALSLLVWPCFWHAMLLQGARRRGQVPGCPCWHRHQVRYCVRSPWWLLQRGCQHPHWYVLSHWPLRSSASLAPNLCWSEFLIRNIFFGTRYHLRRVRGDWVHGELHGRRYVEHLLLEHIHVSESDFAQIMDFIMVALRKKKIMRGCTWINGGKDDSLPVHVIGPRNLYDLGKAACKPGFAAQKVWTEI